MDLDQYKAAYAEAMRMQGVTVTFEPDRSKLMDQGGFINPDNWIATLSRDGVTVQTLVTLGRADTATPEQLAQYDITYALKYTGQVNSAPGVVPSAFFTPIDDDTRRFYEMYPYLAPNYVPTIPPPGPATTVPTGQHSTLLNQSPAILNSGTVITNPTAIPADNTNQMLSFWQWNYYYELQTGRTGPDPAAVGVVDGGALMTGSQWVATIGNWYGAPVSIPSTAPVTSGNVGGTPTTGGVPVGGTGTTGGAGGITVDGTGATGAGPVRNSFWIWNALYEQKTGIPGDDPSKYGISGGDLMTLSEWRAMTSAYYAAKSSGGAGGGAAKPADNTLLYLGAAALAYLALRNRG